MRQKAVRATIKDVIHRVGLDGDFIGNKHTRKPFKEDRYPQLFERRNSDGWKNAGGKTMRQRAQEKALDILTRHRLEPLPQDIQKKPDRIMKQANSG